MSPKSTTSEDDSISLQSVRTALPSSLHTSSKEKTDAASDHPERHAESSISLTDAVLQCLDGTSLEATEQASTLLLLQDTVTEDEATRVLKLLLEHPRNGSISNRLLAELLKHQSKSHKALAEALQHNTRHVLRSCLAAGIDSVKVLGTVLSSEAGWQSKHTREQVLREVYQSCLQELHETQGTEVKELCLTILVRLVSTKREMVFVLSEQSIESLLTLLDIRQPQTVQRQALLVLIRLLDQSQEETTPSLTRLLLRKGSSTSRSDIIIAFSATAALFPILPKLCAELLSEKQVFVGILDCLQSSAGMISDDLRQVWLNSSRAIC